MGAVIIDVSGKVLEHVETASRMLFRANIYFEAWWQSAGVEGRKEFRNFWNEYWNFWQFNEHAMQFAFIVYLAGLFEKRNDTVNFGSLWKEVQPHADQAQREQFEKILRSAQTPAQSVTILRSNAMAHRSKNLNYRDTFKKANITPDQLRELIFCSWQLLNIIETALGMKLSAFDPLVIEPLRKLAALESNRIASEVQ